MQLQYAPGHSNPELKRLGHQAQTFNPFTRHLLQLAGIDSGMRVLDVGCGGGDIAFLAADLVGPEGEVIGVDRTATAVEWASSRARSRGIGNVTFLAGDLAKMQFDRPFDAVVGRLVLMHRPDPVEAVRRVIRRVRNGGLVVFQECDIENCRSFPPAPPYDPALNWIKKPLVVTGVRLQLDLDLFGIFLASGLPQPSLRMDALIGGGPGCPAYQLVAEVVETLLPQIEKQGIATAAEVDILTLADRMRNEVVDRNGVVLSPGLIGAWSRKTTPFVSSRLVLGVGELAPSD